MGLEPTSTKALDFESNASTIPPPRNPEKSIDWIGLEPTTLYLSDINSNQLSYQSMQKKGRNKSTKKKDKKY